MDLAEELNSKLLFLGIFPKCPFYQSVVNIGFIIALIALGTIGLIFLNLWVAVGYMIYSAVFYALLMPIWHCQYCYYKVRETPSDNPKEDNIGKLLPKEKWLESCLQKHVDCGKKWSVNFIILWFLPITGIIISLFLNFSIYALISLIGFLFMLSLMAVHLKRRLCPKCAIMEECQSSF